MGREEKRKGGVKQEKRDGQRGTVNVPETRGKNACTKSNPGRKGCV